MTHFPSAVHAPPTDSLLLSQRKPQIESTPITPFQLSDDSVVHGQQAIAQLLNGRLRIYIMGDFSREYECFDCTYQLSNSASASPTYRNSEYAYNYTWHTSFTTRGHLQIWHGLRDAWREI